MNYDTEKAKIVVKAIEEQSREQGSKYSFAHFCKENGLYHDSDVRRIAEMVISCPFHEDESPSLSINEDKRIWHCFSCDCGGSYLDFLIEYDRKVLGSDVSFYQKVNEILSDDILLQSKLGFSTIVKRQSLFTEFKPVRKNCFKVTRESTPGTWLELGTLLVKRKCTREQVRLAVLLMQSGLDVKFVYKQIFGDSAAASVIPEFSIEELNRE